MLKPVLIRDFSKLVLDDQTSVIDGLVRFSVCQGAQGQFTPASKLLVILQDHFSRKYVGRAALSMLKEGLQEHATPVDGRFKKIPGSQSLSAEDAELHALAIRGLESRVAEMGKSR